MIQHCVDYQRIKALYPKGMRMVESNKILYLIEKEGDNDLGLWALYRYKDGVVIHAQMGIKCRGKKALDSMKNAFKWVFSALKIDRIYAEIPKENKHACVMAVNSGMEFMNAENDNRIFEVQRCRLQL